ncbi:hypothetical protein [Dethiosulfatarculus sandiegensis]|uniref:Uncharacterized protein n=1 Tax=Dethiosulfatarculus sandiegensis TaxID=1429043 RepID=A0A0D2J343_9BACT|nr:hypothetical protein [Dethiosulfatarculus sandiegensis]KIX12599.1 hypothetical protein X474_18515 [Dethiosulfatarculus sandiegensis]
MNAIPLRGWPYGGKRSPVRLLADLGVNAKSDATLAETLPFTAEDTTCGVENELQAGVCGKREDVDLPRAILNSNYYQNLQKRRQRGELPKRAVSVLDEWLKENPNQIWDNSWVRVPMRLLSPLARRILEQDLLADKSDPDKGTRSDAGRFLDREANERILRMPVSYLLKLSLADSVGSQPGLSPLVREAGLKYMGHYLSDNTSPELYSFHTVKLSKKTGMGAEIAKETARRFVLTQLLVQYAESALGLAASGQKVDVYFAPHPPVRQKRLSETIPDAFYRELFMNPCLSGWDEGEKKHHYMHLCHQVLSRAQFNSLGRLKDAGVITNNLVVMPSASNISLANNGTHISLGSRRLTSALADSGSGFSASHEKYLGDLAIKMSEHFLSLFVGNYSAAPYRLCFSDFQPEKLLTFLPYQLDYTHLRMIWRRWKKKARLKTRFLGLRLTPFGPPWLDEPISRIFGLKGDYVPDFRLLDYLVALMSTDRSPALNGSAGNQELLKKDLAQMGVFDTHMPVYMALRQRHFSQMGFSGFEGRHYSLFYKFSEDLGRAADLQTLVTAVAFKLIAKGELTHSHIPDDPQTESERRQIFFGAAIGLPTFFVRADTGNLFLRQILEQTRNLRFSRRYPGYLRVIRAEFQQAAARWLCIQGREIIASLGLEETVQDLIWRLEHPESRSAAGRLTREINRKLNVKSPCSVKAEEFNQACEAYYRDELCQKHLKESWLVLEDDLSGMIRDPQKIGPRFKKALQELLGSQDALDFVQSMQKPVLRRSLRTVEILKLINLVLLNIHMKDCQVSKSEGPERSENLENETTRQASVY